MDESVADELVNLHRLLTEGILTQDEFDRQKARLLSLTLTDSEPRNTSSPSDIGMNAPHPSAPNNIFSNQYPPPSQYAPPSTQISGTAIAALIFAFLFWPVGIVLGHISRNKIRHTGERGAGLALAALIISYVWGSIVILLIIVLAQSSMGFNNLTMLQKSVTHSVDSNLNNPSSSGYSPGTSATSTICVHNAGTQYSCNVTLSNGQSASESITVSADGSRWVSNG